MARATWKRPGSQSARRVRESKPLVQTSVTAALVDDGREQAEATRKRQHPDRVMSVKLQRPIAAIRSKAQREGISLRPVNRSPYNRRAKAAKRG
jgi:IMP dehydrogenase/GMP reductase